MQRQHLVQQELLPGWPPQVRSLTLTLEKVIHSLEWMLGKEYTVVLGVA